MKVGNDLSNPIFVSDKDSKKALECLQYGLNQFYQCDGYLLKNNTSERSMVFRIAHYMSNWMERDLYYYDLDVEYNRFTFNLGGKQESNPKRAILTKQPSSTKNTNEQKENKEEVLFVPDIIIHSREVSECNLAAIEFKKSSAGKGRIKFDKVKLTALTQSKEFHYKIGLLVVLSHKAYEISFFEHGKEIYTIKESFKMGQNNQLFNKQYRD